MDGPPPHFDSDSDLRMLVALVEVVEEYFRARIKYNSIMLVLVSTSAIEE